MNQPGRSPMQIGFWTMLCVSIFAWAPATYPGYWQALEGFLPVFNSVSNSAISDIGMMPDLWRGSGSGTYLLVRPLVLAGLSATTAVRINFALALLLGALGTYSWIRPRMGDRTAGLTGLIYLFMPTFLSTIYVRGSLSDALVMALFPVLMTGVHTYALERSSSAIGVIVLGQLWLWRIQPGLAVFVTLFIILYALWIERDGLTTLVTIVSSLSGIVSLIPLWSFSAPPPVDYADHFVYFFQLFGTDWQIVPSTAGWQDGYPFQLGLVAHGFSIVAIWYWWRQPVRNSELNRFLWFTVATSSVLIVSSLQSTAPFWQWVPIDRLLTYPWQLLLIASLPLAVFAGSVISLNGYLQTTSYWCCLILLVVLGSHAYLTADFTQYDPAERPAAIYGHNQELLILEAEVSRSDERGVATLDVVWQALRQMDFDYNIFFQAIERTDDGINVISQIDVQPRQGNRPAMSWKVGEIITDTYELDVSFHPHPDTLQYYFGYYNWNDGSRLPVEDSITGIRDDKLVLYGQ